MGKYDKAYYTIEDTQEAEKRTRGILGHNDITDRVEFMISRNLTEMMWFKFTDCERDLISDYSGIKPRFKTEE